MSALFAAAVILAHVAPAPLEDQATSSLQRAQSFVRSADPGRGLAALDSLLMSNGVALSIDGGNAEEPAVGKAIDCWNQALGERTFRLVPKGQSADIVVRFVRSLDDKGENVQGYVQATRKLAWSDRIYSYRLQGTIFVRDNVDGRRLRTDEILAVVAHETGHLLGLADVDRDDRLMGPMTIGEPHKGPSPVEVAAVRSYRAAIRDSYPKP